MTILRITVASLLLTTSLISAEAQCSKGGGRGSGGGSCQNGGGYPPIIHTPGGGYNNGGYNNGGYNNGGQVFPGSQFGTVGSQGAQQPRALQTASARTQIEEAPEPDFSNTDEQEALRNELDSLREELKTLLSAQANESVREQDEAVSQQPTDEGEFEVVVQNPDTGDLVPVRQFTTRSAAEAGLNAVSNQLWLVSRTADGSREFELGAATAVARHLQASGASVQPVTAQLRKVGDVSLAGGFKLTSPAPAADSGNRLLETVTQLADTAPENDEFDQLAGEWESVILSDSGEPVKIRLKLDAGGTTTITIPDGAGGVRTVEARAETIDGEFSLLGQRVEEIQQDRIILGGPDGRVTLTRKSN